MSTIIGARVSVGISRETTRGVAELTNFYWLPWTAWSFDDKTEKYVCKEALGVIDDSPEQYLTAKWGEGNIEGEIRDKSFGLLLYAALGAWSSGANGAAFNHTFTVAQTNQHTSLTVFVNDPNKDYLFELAMVENLEITIETGKLASYSVGLVSRGSQTTSMVAGINTLPTMATLGTENKFIATNAAIRLANDKNAFGPAPEISLQNIKLIITKNLLRKQILGSVTPDDIINQTLSVEGSFELPYKDQIYKDYDLGNTYKAMEIVLENRNVDLGGGIFPKIRITLPRVGFMNWTPVRPKGELYEQTIGFRAFRDVTNSDDTISSIVLTNAVGLTGY